MTDPLFQKIGINYYWYQNDHLGTPQKIVDTSGSVVWSAIYNTFGKAQIQVAAIENNLRFPGQYYDQETGLHYNYLRYYDPMTGRYVTPDPIGLEGGINLYPYVWNSPLGFIDPLGMEACLWPCLADAGLNAVIGFIPGLNMVSLIADIGGVDFTPFQAKWSDRETSWVTFDGGLTDTAAGVADAGRMIATGAYKDAGGDIGYKNAEDLLNRKSFTSQKPRTQAKWTNRFKRISRLRKAMKIMKVVAPGLNLVDFAFDAYACFQKCKDPGKCEK